MHYHQSSYTPFQSFLYPVLYQLIISMHRFLEKQKLSMGKACFIQVIQNKSFPNKSNGQS